MTVAIYGPWGSGKTTILKHLKHELEEPAWATRPRAVTVWFEPWRYETEPNLMVPLLIELTADVFSSAALRAGVARAP